MGKNVTVTSRRNYVQCTRDVNVAMMMIALLVVHFLHGLSYFG